MSIPMSYEFRSVPLSLIREFVETHHYSHNVNGLKVSNCFALFDDGRLVGAIIFGPLSTTAWKKYGTSEADVVELRRLVCLDECPRNTESWFISKGLKELKKEKRFKVCVSYADPFHSHAGYIYQASNWSYWGKTSKDVLLKTPEGRTYHSRAMRTTYKGRLKPFAARLQEQWSDGNLEKVVVPGKHVYTYSLIGVHKRVGVPYPKGNQNVI